MTTTIQTELDKLHKLLAEQYPSYHWNHIDVFSAYWALVKVTEDK